MIGKPIDILVETIESSKPTKDEEQLMKYPPSVISKAKQLKEIFEESDLTTLLEFINQNPDENLEELASNYVVWQPTLFWMNLI